MAIAQLTIGYDSRLIAKVNHCVGRVQVWWPMSSLKAKERVARRLFFANMRNKSSEMEEGKSADCADGENMLVSVASCLLGRYHVYEESHFCKSRWVLSRKMKNSKRILPLSVGSSIGLLRTLHCLREVNVDIDIFFFPSRNAEKRRGGAVKSRLPRSPLLILPPDSAKRRNEHR